MSRAFVVARYAALLGLPAEHALCVNLEKSTHNWAVKKTESMLDIPASDNHRHMSRYKHKFLEMQRSLRCSPTLASRILSGQLKTNKALELSPDSLWPGGPYAKAKERGIKRDMAKDYNLANEKDYKGLFRCNKCRGYKTTYYEMQTRSADEPMTVFVTCHVCKLTWKS
jgi:DNA-directed RNA polymerase subunit M/transcription elongation factor TFIIS